jgi:hypothetical protein
MCTKLQLYFECKENAEHMFSHINAIAKFSVDDAPAKQASILSYFKQNQ